MSPPRKSKTSAERKIKLYNKQWTGVTPRTPTPKKISRTPSPNTVWRVYEEYNWSKPRRTPPLPVSTKTRAGRPVTPKRTATPLYKRVIRRLKPRSASKKRKTPLYKRILKIFNPGVTSRRS